MDKERLDSILQDGFRFGAPDYYDLELLARYYRGKGYGKVGIRKRLIEKTRELFPDFNEVIYGDALNDAVNRGYRKGAVAPMKEFTVFQEELDSIRKHKNWKGQLILFTMLVKAKSIGYNSLLATPAYNIKRVINSAGTRVTYRQFLSQFFPRLIDDRLVIYDRTYRLRGDLRGKYTFPIIVSEGKPVLVFSSPEDVRNCVERYKEWTGGELFWCDVCGEENLRVKNNQRRCQECQQDARREWDRERKAA